MSTLPGPNNAIAYAQFRLQGGLRGTLLMAGICLAVLVGLLTLNVVSEATAGRPMAAATADWPQGLVALQLLFLLVIGPLRVVAAVRGDVTSRMLESHRLMPLTPAGAVAGYAAGAPWAAVVLATATFALGGALCLTGGTDPSRFLLAHVVLGLIAVATWVITTYLSMASRLGVLVLVVGGICAATGGGGGGPASLVPGLEVITAPLINHSVVPLRGGNFTPAAGIVGLVAYAAVAVICFRAAMRLYRAPGAIGLSPTLGLLLLGVWVAASVAGLVWPDVFEFRRFYQRTAPSGVQLVGSTVAAVLLAGLPIAAAAKGAERRHQAAEPATAWSVWTVAVAATALVIALAVVAGRAMPDLVYYRDSHSGGGGQLSGPASAALVGRAVRVTPAVVAAAVLGLTFTLRLAYLRLERAWVVAAVWLFLAWLLPLMVDPFTTSDPNGFFGPVASVSPIGALAILWTQSNLDPTRGVAMQFAVAAGPAVLYLTAVINRRRREAITGGSPA